VNENLRHDPPHRPVVAPARLGEGSGTSAEEAFESLITSLVLTNALVMPHAEREALFERILNGEGVTLERDGDWVEIHLVGKTIASLDLHWLVRRKDPDEP
jgi:hypothetical protein